ncbi:MAG: Gfo/Idh/MocA family protein [Chthonomonadales bacterium]
MENHTSKIRIGFVGVGAMGQCAHLRNYVLMPDCQVVAIAEVKPRLRELVQARYGIPRSYASHEEMLANEALDGIVAAQPFTRHGTLIPQLLAAGKPVFIEKPLAASIPMGRRIVEAARANGTWVMVGYHKRSDPATMEARSRILALKESGAAGKLTYVRITMPAGDWIASGFDGLITTDEPAPPLDWDAPPADMDPKTYEAYVSFVNYYIHQVNLLRYLLNEPYRVTYADRSGVLLVGEAQSGIPCIIEMSPYTTTIDWQERAFVAFEHATLTLDLPAPLAQNRPGRLELFEDVPGSKPVRTCPQLPWVHAMKQQAANFIAAIRGLRPAPCLAEEALLDLEVARDAVQMRTSQAQA